jgi:hypothetical protein
MRHYLIPIQKAGIKKTKDNKRQQEYGQKETLEHWWEYKLA